MATVRTQRFTGWARTAALLSLALTLNCKTSSHSEKTAVLEKDARPLTQVAPAPEPPLAGQVVNGFQIANFEYWPFRWREDKGTCPYPYPSAVRYGFNSGSEPAKKCMRAAYAGLWAMLQDPPPALRAWRDRGGPNSIYLGVNDYTEAKADTQGEPVPECQPDVSMRGIWHFNPPRGQIKWVSEVYKDGSCKLQTVEEASRFAAEALSLLENGG